MQPVEGAVVACAGLGSRLGMGLPKCMIEVGGQTILGRLIESLRMHVPRIHVVIGYREEIIAEYCARNYRDIVLVRNPDFRNTNTAQSMALGSVGFECKVAYMDGDLLISPSSLEQFLNRAVDTDILIGVTPAKTEHAVFVRLDNSPSNTMMVTSFTREECQQNEWANIFTGPPNLLTNANGFVYEALQAHLPIACAALELHEIDTPSDLEQARIFIRATQG